MLQKINSTIFSAFILLITLAPFSEAGGLENKKVILLAQTVGTTYCLNINSVLIKAEVVTVDKDFSRVDFIYGYVFGPNNWMNQHGDMSIDAFNAAIVDCTSK